MKLCDYMLSNEKATAIVAKFQKVSRSATEDVVSAINYLVECTVDRDEIEERIDVACAMCTYMEPAVEDVITVLLHMAYPKNKASNRIFGKIFREDRYEHYYNQMHDAYRHAPEVEGWSRTTQIDHFAMMRVCDRTFDNLTRSMSKKGIPDVGDVVTAYEMAREAHYNDKRKCGNIPYLTHPLAVASILCEVEVESPIIAAALLHDVAEDTNYTLDDIAEKCGKTIANYVDAVTSVHRQYENSLDRNEYSKDKSQLDARSFEKLAAAVAGNPKMISALYIKAADRIHNLRTIDKMSDEKKHCKTDETEQHYLPLFKKFKLNYFVNIIEDLSWRTNNVDYYEAIKAKYDDIVFRNQRFVDETKQLLTILLCEEFGRFCDRREMGCDAYNTITVSERYYLTQEVYAFAKKHINKDTEVTPEHIEKKFIPVCDFDIIIDSRDTKGLGAFISMFTKMYIDKIAPTGRIITNLQIENEERFIVMLEDAHRTLFRLCFSTRDAYITSRLGSCNGVFIDEPDDIVVEQKDIVRIKLRNGKIIELPIGSTVIDVAYAIHPEVGHAAISAIINGHEADIYHRVHENDHVVIKADTYRENGTTKKFIPHVKINWLNHVTTAKARKAIIKRLIDQYGEEDPRNENNASDVAASRVADTLKDSLGAIGDFNKLN